MIRQTEPVTITTAGAPKSSRGRSRKRKADVAIPVQDQDGDFGNKTKKKHRPSQTFQNQTAGCSSQSRPSCSSHQVDALFGSSTFGSTHYLTPTRPLPDLCWASKDDMCSNLLRKDQLFQRDASLMERHPNLQPEMRAILLDWLIKICDIFNQHREVYYLAQDYFDRFMATQENVLPFQLPLIGISAIYIAMKMEDSYYLRAIHLECATNGVCKAQDIIRMEAHILKELDWKLSSVTPVSWLKLYLQIAHLEECSDLLVCHFPGDVYAQSAELLDYCTLVVKSLKFSNSVLAAAALFHCTSRELAMKVSGLKWRDLKHCVKWMKPFLHNRRTTTS